jgi:predicted RNA-binding Zn-ribbon protein involved in translation (DUF1610 family)
MTLNERVMVVKESEADFVCPDCGAELCLEGLDIMHEHNWTPVVDQRYDLFVVEFCPDCNEVREVTKEGCQKPSVLLSEAPQHVRNLFDQHGNRLSCKS